MFTVLDWIFRGVHGRWHPVSWLVLLRSKFSHPHILTQSVRSVWSSILGVMNENYFQGFQWYKPVCEIGNLFRVSSARRRHETACSPVASLYKPYMNPEIAGTIRFFGDFVLVRCRRYQIQLLPVWQLWGESANCINPKWPPLKLGQILKQQ